MLLAEKIMILRKKKGWSQEELAYQLDVSRQAISKWESGNSLPDLDKIILMSSLFNISTDILVKDDLDLAESGDKSDTMNTRALNREAVEEYLTFNKNVSWKYALAVALLIMSPVMLIALLSYSSIPGAISESLAIVIGLMFLFFQVAISVFIFVVYGIKSKDYSFLENEQLLIKEDVKNEVGDRKKRFTSSYIFYLTLGIILCILSPIPLIIVSVLDINEQLSLLMICFLFFVVAIGVFMIIISAMRKEGYDKILQIGEYNLSAKKVFKKKEQISSIYWPLMAGFYLLISFLTGRWDITWIIWVVAGVLFSGIMALFGTKSRD